MPLADFMLKVSRDDKALESRALLCSALVGDRAHYELNVFHAANQDPFSDTPEGKQAGWNYWVEGITDRLYWLIGWVILR